MKKWLICLILTCTQSSLAVETVENLDIDRYMGKWHQIATIPQSFSEDCVQNTTAEYEKLETGQIKVINSCEEADGNVNVAEGRARVNEEFNMNSKLQVTFVNTFFGWVWLFGGDYWVINLDENYEWSIVGNPDLDALWILSRSENMSDETLKELRDFIQSVGYDSCAIIMSKNSNGGAFSGTERYCDLNL